MTSDGLLRCSRYAFGPNRLHYCGPDANQELFAYLENEASDPGLEQILQAFKTLYPYLRLIARANGIRDTFAASVVEAYWIGNRLLDNVRTNVFYDHLRYEQQIGKRLGLAALETLATKVAEGAVPHHSFHVLDIWKRTGHLERAHTLESMDACRISWGTVVVVDGPFLSVQIQPLTLTNGQLALGTPIIQRITRSLGAELDIESLQPGNILTMHWGVPCEIITQAQALELKRRTLDSLRLANETL